jgi:hypothetical protein
VCKRSVPVPADDMRHGVCQRPLSIAYTACQTKGRAADTVEHAYAACGQSEICIPRAAQQTSAGVSAHFVATCQCDAPERCAATDPTPYQNT